MACGEGLGRVFNTVAAASGVSVSMRDCTAVTFVCYLDAGTQGLTLTEDDSTGVQTEQALATIARLHKGPGAGGTWTEVTQIGSSTYTHADAVNDCVVYTVRAEQLSDGYDAVQMTVDSGTCIALMHDLLVQRDPTNLATSII